MALNSHPRVATAVVSQDGNGLRATVLRTRRIFWRQKDEENKGIFWASGWLEAEAMLENEPLSAEEISQIVTSAGYALSPVQVSFVDTYEELPENRHNRVVLLDLLRACFAEADTNGDGAITIPEFTHFLNLHGIKFPEEENFAAVFEKYDVDRDYVLEFEEFKSFLLQTRLLAVQDNNRDGVAEQFGIDESLFRVLTKYFFSKVDLDKDGFISVEETREVLQAYGFEARQFQEVFDRHDANKDGAIDELEFRALLAEEGIVRPVEPKPPSQCSIL
jgi:Ca2+-binding EF-hand superfamily protein